MIKNISTAKSLKGEITIPADKSISHRAVMFSALSKGVCKISNFLHGADCISTLNLFKNLGMEAEFKENILLINSKKGLISPSKPLDCGNSGTTMRLCSGILAGQDFNSILIGDKSLSKRPMKRVITPLTEMGAEIISNGFAPLEIRGKRLHGIDYISPLSSAQVKSCILLAGLDAQGKTSFTEPYLSRNHSELLFKYMGVDISQEEVENGIKTTIRPAQLQPKDIEIVGDISSAAFFIVAALIVPNSDVIIRNVGLNPTRTGIIDVVQKMGGSIEIIDKREASGEIVGDLRVKYSQLKSCEISGEIIPKLIDELPVIAVLATQAQGQTIIKDAQDLRNKESDRIKAVVGELKKLGADIEERQDGFIVNGKKDLHGECEIQTYHDHRLAMSMYVAGLICKKEISINGFEWVGISFPEFEEYMQML